MTMSAGKGKFTAIPERESLTTEFKSDRKGLPDKILVDEVVGMANASGGRIFLGVEDDGRPTGVRAEHEDPTGLMALVANRTVPPVSVEARLVRAGTSRVMEIVVPKGISVISSSDGRVVRRRLRQDGEPEIVPMFPYEYATRLSDLGRMDFSARTIDQASRSDLDPNERERLRNVIRNRDGDRSLLALSDEELDKALGLVAETPAGLKPTVAGMLVIGRRESLRKYVPTHAEAFQALDGNVVRIDDSTNEPILAAVEHFERNLTPWNPEDEFTLDMARIPVPLFSVDGFREALVNAFCHRNYSILGTVSVQVAVGQGLTVSSPGGFIDGVSLQNLLTVQPHGRNPALADILKRTGLAEKTGRGIDRIFEGAIRLGRPLPDFSETTARNVTVFMRQGASDLPFAEMIARKQRQLKKSFSTPALLVLWFLRSSRSMTVAELARRTTLGEERILAALEELSSCSLVLSGGKAGASNRYRLDAASAGIVAPSVRKPVDDWETLALRVIRLCEKKGGELTAGEIADYLGVNRMKAWRILKKLADEGKIRKKSGGRYASYQLALPESVAGRFRER